ncbi:amino acid ABC transporter permease [Ornithinimicrobium cavernae]|uniref:amino acid ABC transporter permease n=1 Tax=Ornithinimicrobium cavernae TaxID=2666047 RepID=UPI000D68DC0C|nr:amino acid ABC transporter permease [Ornithinimicrobium cavernae]
MASATADPIGESSLPIRKRPKLVQWALIAVLGLVVAAGAFSVVNNENFGWPIVFEYFTSPRILSGLVRTLHLTALSMAIGIVLGVILALMHMSRNRFVQSIAWAYIWFFRGTPVFVQLLFWGSISALYPKLILGLPFGGPAWLEMSANDLITPYIAAVLGLGLNEAAYMAEIVRAGIKSVDRGQSEAATALGMPDGLTTRRVVLPQAMRVIIPPTGNQLIGMLKTSSLVAVLAYPELLYSAQLIYAVNYQTIPLLITASLWYLLITSVLSVGQYYLERHFGRSEARSSLEAR